MFKQLVTLLVISLFFTFTVNAKSGFTFPPNLMTKLDELTLSSSPSPEVVEIPEPPRSEEMTAPQTDSVKMRLIITPEKNSYKLGEHIKLTVVSNQPCYLTLVDFGTSGVANILLPNKYQPSNFLNKGDVFKVPNQRFSLKVGGKIGKEKIWGICTKDNTPIFRSYYDFNQQSFISLGQGRDITDIIQLPQQYDTSTESRDSVTIQIKRGKL